MDEQDGPADEGGRKRTYSAPALEKGMDILELLSTEPEGLTISEIGQGLGRSIGEIFRVIVVMERRGWLRKGGGDRFCVTYRLLDIAFRATPASELSSVAAPIMRELAASINQSCHLVVVGDRRGLVVQRQENLGQVGFGIRLGAAVDLLTSCSGHVLLAFAAEGQRTQLIGSLGAAGRASAKTLSPRLEMVREQGYEMQPSARTAGVTDISFPVFGFNGQIVAALTVPFLVMIDGSQRTSLDETRDLLRLAAEQVSARMGWMGSPDRAELRE